MSSSAAKIVVIVGLLMAMVVPGHTPSVSAAPTPTADLVITAFSVSPTQPVQGQPATIRITVRNQGTGAAAEGFVVQWKSDKNSPTGPADTVPGLAAGASTTVVLTYSFPKAGNFTTVATVDTGNAVDETNESNNLEILSVSVTPAQPDLLITGFTINPASPVAGLPATIKLTVKNQGGGAAGGFVVQWKSAQNAPSGPAVPVVGLAAGASTVVQFTYTFPQAGNFTTVATVDTDKSVPETNENNNLAILSITVQKATIDLSVTSVTFDPNPPVRGWLTKVAVTVKNSGNFPAGSFIVKWAPRPFAPTLSSQVSGLGPGQSTTVMFDYTYPAAGTFSTVAEVDSTNTVREINEANNKLTVSVTVDPPLADLVVSDLTISPPQPVKKLSAKTTVVVKNQGHIDATSFIVTWKPSPLAPALSTQVNGLAAGASTAVVFNYTYPNSGSFKSVAEVDSTKRVRELSEDNNTKTLQVTVLDAFVDLQITSITLKPTVPIKASPATFSVTVQNVGNSPSGAFLLQLNPDSLGLVTPSMATVSSEIANLNGGQSTTVNFTLVYPKAGNFRAVGKVDAFNTVKETNEDNNLRLLDVTVSPIPVDLTITGMAIQSRDGEGQPRINPPGNVIQGTQFTVLITVKNIGTAPAGSFLVQWNPDATGISMPSLQTLSRQVNSLGAGQSTVVAFDFEYPKFGNFRSVAKVDAFNTIEETNEANNQDILNMVVQPALIDLVITSFSLNPASPVRGSKVTATIVIRNNGNFHTNNFAVQWKPVSTAGFGPIAQINGLNPGESRTVTLQGSFLVAGPATSLATVDAFNSIIETNENNNTSTLKVQVQPRVTRITLNFNKVKAITAFEDGINGEGEWQVLYAVLDPNATCVATLSPGVIDDIHINQKGLQCQRKDKDDLDDGDTFNPNVSFTVNLVEAMPLMLAVTGVQDGSIVEPPDFVGVALQLWTLLDYRGVGQDTIDGQQGTCGNKHCFDLSYTIHIDSEPPALFGGATELTPPSSVMVPDAISQFVPVGAKLPAGLIRSKAPQIVFPPSNVSPSAAGATVFVPSASR